MPIIKYGDNMSEAETAAFEAELDRINEGYTRAAQAEQVARLIFNLVGCLNEVLDCEGDVHNLSYDRYREVLAEAKALGYPAFEIEDVYDADDELRRAALNRGQP